MHPEIADRLREGARKYLAAALAEGDPYARMAEKSVISFDDIYFLGVVNEAHSIRESGLVETGQVDVVEQETPLGAMQFAVTDTVKFRDRVSNEGYRLVGELFNINPEAAEERFYEIQRRVTECHNRELKDEKKL